VHVRHWAKSANLQKHAVLKSKTKRMQCNDQRQSMGRN
jgi:hypothetical protein